jgi:hypothetical protein
VKASAHVGTLDWTWMCLDEGLDACVAVDRIQVCRFVVYRNCWGTMGARCGRVGAGESGRGMRASAVCT